MTDFLNFVSNTSKESVAINRLINWDSISVTWETIDCRVLSKYIKPIEIEPIISRYSLGNFESIISHPIILPDKDSISLFLSNEFIGLLIEDFDETDSNEIIDSLRSFLMITIFKNITHLLDFYKSNDQQPEKELRQNVENH